MAYWYENAEVVQIVLLLVLSLLNGFKLLI